MKCLRRLVKRVRKGDTKRGEGAEPLQRANDSAKRTKEKLYHWKKRRTRAPAKVEPGHHCKVLVATENLCHSDM